VSSYATYGARVGGWLIDWVVTSIIGSIALVPLHAVRQVDPTSSGSQPAPLFHLAITDQGALLFVLLVIIYTTACTGSARGQTIGMMVVHARVVDANNGTPIGYGRALGRVLVEYALLFFLLLPWVVDMAFPLWDRRRQTLHDKAANAVVVTT